MILTRLATMADLAELLLIVRQFYQHFGFPWDGDRKRSLLESLLGQPDVGRVWVIVRDARIVGYALVAYWFSLEFDGRTALLDEFYLTAEARGSGAGNSALEAIERELLREGIRVIRLEVDQAHDRASTLYARRGYAPSPRVLWRKNLP